MNTDPVHREEKYMKDEKKKGGGHNYRLILCFFNLSLMLEKPQQPPTLQNCHFFEFFAIMGRDIRIQQRF